MVKMIIVKMYMGGKSQIVTVDGTNKNQVTTYDDSAYSTLDLAKRIVKRTIDEKFDKVYVDVNGLGAMLNDTLIGEFAKENYTYNPENGSVVINKIEINEKGIFLSGGTLTSKILDPLKNKF